MQIRFSEIHEHTVFGNKRATGSRSERYRQAICSRETLRMSAANNESDSDPTASDDRVPDAPERPKMENAATNKREKHPSPRADCRRTRTLAPSARLLRTMPEIQTRQSDRRQSRTARSTGVNSSNHFKNLLRKGGDYGVNKTKKPKLQRAKAEVQGELDPAAQKDSTV